MKTKVLALIVFASTIMVLYSAEASFAQMQGNSQTCETCPMEVGAEAQAHLKVTDGNGTRHYVECIGCALKLLNAYDTIHIETYCDWYGPEYKITADISQQGAVTDVDPESALLLVGGGCTGNRVAYNQTAADALLANGYSQYTMMMMQQPLPANTNTTTIAKRALTFTAATVTSEPSQSPLVIIGLGAVAAVIVVGSVVAYKKLRR